MHGDIPAACPRRSAISSHTCTDPPATPASPGQSQPHPCPPCRCRSTTRDQRLAAVGQLQQQLHRPMSAHPAQHPQRRPCNGWRTRVTFTAAGRSLRPVVSRGFVRFRGSLAHGQGGGSRCHVPWAVLYVIPEGAGFCQYVGDQRVRWLSASVRAAPGKDGVKTERPQRARTNGLDVGRPDARRRRMPEAQRRCVWLWAFSKP